MVLPSSFRIQNFLPQICPLALWFGSLLWKLVRAVLPLKYSSVVSYSQRQKTNMTGMIIDDTDEDETYALKIFHFTKEYGVDSDKPDPDAVSEGPQPCSGHRIQCTDSCLYLVGGFHPPRTLFRHVWRFDFVTRKWLKLDSENMPKELASCSILLSGNLLFLSCGTGIPFGNHLNGTMYYCNLPKSGTSIKFKEIKSCSHSPYTNPPPCYGHCMAINNDHLYMVGGTTGNMYSIDVHALNMRSSEWTRLYDTRDDGGPTARYRHEMICYNDRLYIFGGGTTAECFSLKTIPAFNLKTNRWETFETIGDDEDGVEKFPGKRKCHGCVQDPCRPSVVFINGGLRDPHPRAFNDTWRIDLDTFKWKRIPSLTLPYGVYFHSVSVTPNGRMYLFGGCTDTADPHERTADMFSAWITIPKLADVCWDALQYYVRKGTITLPEDIQSFGLPRKYQAKLK